MQKIQIMRQRNRDIYMHRREMTEKTNEERRQKEGEKYCVVGRRRPRAPCKDFSLLHPYHSIVAQVEFERYILNQMLIHSFNYLKPYAFQAHGSNELLDLHHLTIGPP